MAASGSGESCCFWVRRSAWGCRCHSQAWGYRRHFLPTSGYYSVAASGSGESCCFWVRGSAWGWRRHSQAWGHRRHILPASGYHPQSRASQSRAEHGGTPASIRLPQPPRVAARVAAFGCGGQRGGAGATPKRGVSGVTAPLPVATNPSLALSGEGLLLPFTFRGRLGQRRKLL